MTKIIQFQLPEQVTETKDSAKPMNLYDLLPPERLKELYPLNLMPSAANTKLFHQMKKADCLDSYDKYRSYLFNPGAYTNLFTLDEALLYAQVHHVANNLVSEKMFQVSLELLIERICNYFQQPESQKVATREFIKLHKTLNLDILTIRAIMCGFYISPNTITKEQRNQLEYVEVYYK